MICLEDDNFINQGTLRACYHHPKDRRFIIKVPAGDKKESELANLKEMKGYHALMREQIDLFCISHCYGFVSTNRGKGLVCDCIRDDDGTVSKTILDIITGDDCDVDYIVEVAKGLCNTLISNRIYLFDINVKNIALKLRHDGTYQPFVIDLKGRYDNNEFLPLSSYVKYFALKKVARRGKQLIERIELWGKNKKPMK